MTQPIPQGYKQTEIGVIPEDWEVASISDRHVIATGSTPPTADLTNYGQDYLFVSPADLSDKKYVIETEKKLSTKGFLISRKYPAGSTLFTCIGSTIGKTGYATIEMTSNQQINAVFPSDLECPEFSYYALTSIANRIKELAGEQAVPLVNKTDFGKTKYCYPKNKLEQTAIATALSDVDALISGLESLIAKKQAIKTATMQQLLTGKTRLPQFAHHPDGTAKGYKQTELGLVPEDWGVRNLGDLLEYEQPTKYLVSHAKFLNEGSYPVLTAGKSFVLGYTNETNGIFTDLPVIIFDDFTTDSKFVNFPFKAKSSAMKMLKPRNKKTPLSLIYNLLNSVDYLVGDHKRHWIGEFQFLNVAMPSDYEEQTAIAQILSDMDEEIQALETRLNKTKQIKHGMMQVLLTGKVRLV